jgi:hypothetical protein
LNTDKLNSVPPLAAVQAAYSAISSIQHLPAEEQVAGVALLFTTMVSELGISPLTIIGASQRRAKDADSYYTTEIRALRAYINGEIKK